MSMDSPHDGARVRPQEQCYTKKKKNARHRAKDDTVPSKSDIGIGPFAETMTRIGRERGWPRTSRTQFEAECDPHGALLVGSPQQVIDKMLYVHELLGLDPFPMQLTVGPMPHEKELCAIELLGTEVAPAVRKALGAAKVHRERRHHTARESTERP